MIFRQQAQQPTKQNSFTQLTLSHWKRLVWTCSISVWEYVSKCSEWYNTRVKNKRQIVKKDYLFPDKFNIHDFKIDSPADTIGLYAW